MKVYIVTRTERRDYYGDDVTIEAAFDSLEKAKEYISEQKSSYNIEYDWEEEEVR